MSQPPGGIKKCQNVSRNMSSKALSWALVFKPTFMVFIILIVHFTQSAPVFNLLTVVSLFAVVSLSF